MEKGNGTIMTEYNQVCVWESTIVEKEQSKEFEDFMLNEYKIRVKFLEMIYTFPDYENGRPVDGTGGRADTFFLIHDEDIPKFAVPRLSMNPPVRWIEDVFGNGGGKLYPAQVKKYCKWNEEAIEEAEQQ